jgi:signal transduction histidine kinase
MSPVLGYGLAVFGAVGGTWVGVPLSALAPGFGLRGLLGMLVIALLALTWGAGPSLLATLLGASMLGLVLPISGATPGASATGTALGVGLFGLVGLAVTVSATRTARAHRFAQEAARRAQQAVRERDAFLSDAAHELKTPISSLHGFSQVLLALAEKGTLDTERGHRALRHIELQSDKINHLIDRLLDVARLEAGRLVLECGQADLTRLSAEVVAAAQARTQSHSVILQSSGPVWATVDRLRLEQVMTNLVDNAIKYSPQGGPITVGVTLPDAATVCLTVRDQGLGVPEEYRTFIFDRLGQGHAASHRSGLGLGLYISRQIVEMHGGTLDATFPEGGGSVFRVRLPRAAD